VTVRDAVAAALVVAGVAIEVFAALGVVLMRDALDRLHYVGASLLGSMCVGLAVVVAEGPSVIGLKALLTVAFLAVTGPVLGHATARAIHLHRRPGR
jgi:multicomponent Na+:H+ antiporter subunit G